MKPILILFLCSLVLSQTAVLPTSDDVPGIILSGIESELSENNFKLIAGSDRQALLREQAFQLTGATQNAVSVGRLLGARRIVQVSLDRDESVWSVCLKLLDVEEGSLEASDCHIIEGSLADCLSGSRYLVRKMLGLDAGKDIKVVKVREHSTITVKEPVTTIIHKPIEGTVRKFVPCSFCSGTGKVKGKDCPLCTTASKYSGPETKWQPMTGSWKTFTYVAPPTEVK